METASGVASHTLLPTEQLIAQCSRVVEDMVSKVVFSPSIPFVHGKRHLFEVAPHVLSSLIISDSLRWFVSLLGPLFGASSVNVLALVRLLTSLSCLPCPPYQCRDADIRL